MSDATGPSRKLGPPQAQSSGSGRTMMTAWRQQQPYLHEPISSKRVCFYKSGDSQFSGLPVVINNRTFKTFESLLDSLSRRVPLPFGVRTITTPRGHTAVRSLEQLHHGHNYICSDQRTVKPVDLERARRRPPPWYHARPASGPQRRALKQQRQEVRSRRRRRRREATPHLLSTPRRLVVFRNGRPEEKHTVLLQKRSARSFEALLDYVSEVMHFPVVKLYMPDGHRVDGLPALILCSGVLVAAGREPFKVGDYDTQRPIAPTWLPAKRVGTKWVHPSRRKKKSGSSSVKSRIFSPSSERFFVNQIRNSVAGSVGDAAGSLEMEASNALGSLAGTDVLTYGEGTGDNQALPDDDIEKSFRVNQDGSMTVEMKVRLTLKEEETVHWTTTLCRSTVTNQMMDSSIVSDDVDPGLTGFNHFPPPPDPDDDPDIAAIETTCGDSQDLAPPVKNNSSSETSEPVREKEEERTGNAQVPSPLACRVPTPGPRKVTQMQSSEEKVLDGSETEIQRDVVGSYSYREEKQEYCIVQQTSSRPVPKPRNSNLSETNKTIHSSTSVQSEYKSAEVLKLQDSGEEIRETVLHIYEQQTCQDNFVANTQFRVREVATYSRPTSSETVLPASSERTPRSSSLDGECEQDPSTTTKSNSEGRQIDELSSSNLNTHSSGTDNCSNAIPGEKMSDSNQHATEDSADTQSLAKKRKPVTFMLNKNSQIFQSTASEKKRKENVAEILRGIRKRKNSPGTSAGPVKTAERLKAKSAQKLLKKRHKMQPAEYDVSVSDMSSQQPKEIITQAKEHQNELSKLNDPVTDDNKAEKGDTLNVQQKKNVLEVEGLRGKGTLIRQTSMHEEKQSTRETAELSESVSLPARNSSSSMINEYVEQWLLTSRHDAISDMDEEPSCNVHPVSQSASQLGDDPKALFQVSFDGEGSPGFDSEINHAAEEPSKDVLSTSMPCLMQSSQISQDLNKTAEPSQPTSGLVQSQENASSKSNALETETLHTDLPLMKSPLSVNSTVENNAVSANNAVAKDIQPCEVSDEKRFSLYSRNFNDLPPPRPLPRANTLEKKQSASHSSPKKSSPTHDAKKVPVLGISNFERTRSRYESQRKTANSNQTTDNKHQPSGHALDPALLKSFTSVKPSPISTLKGNTEVVTTAATERNVASCNSSKNTNGQALKNITFPPPPQETKSKPQTSAVVPAPTGSYTVRMAARPDMKPVVEQVCLSIQSIKVTSRQARPSCLEKSNSLPDFSSHIASTFGSSSRVLLAFLSVMALKDGLSNLNSNKQLGIDNLIYSEALRLLNSLKELARIEDAQVLSESLSALQNSISRHLLQSWRGFRELSEQARSRSVTPSSSGGGPESDGPTGMEPEEEKVIEELMGELGVPERVREELAALHSEGENSVYKQGGMKVTPLLQLKEERVVKDEASQFQSEKMKFNEKVMEARNREQRSEEQKMAVRATGESHPKNGTVTVQQSGENIEEDNEGPHKGRALGSMPEIPLNGFTESHPIEDTVSLTHSVLSAQMQSVKMPYNDPKCNVVLPSSSLMPKVSSDEGNMSADESQFDPKCQFTYMDSQADNPAQSKTECDTHVSRKLSDDEEKPGQEKDKDNDATESKGVDVLDPEDGGGVIPTEKEDIGIELQSGAEEKPSCSDDNKSCQEDEEDEEDICEELMGFSEEPGEEIDKPSDTEMQQYTQAGVEYITNSNVTSLTEEHIEEMDKTDGNHGGAQGGLSQTKEPHVFEMKHAEKEDHREMESTAATKDREDNDSGQKVCPSHKERPPSPMEQHIILDNPECYSVYQESYLAEAQWTTGEMKGHETASLLYPKERDYPVEGLVSNLEEQQRHVEQEAKRFKSEHSMRSHIEVPEVSENDDLTSVSHLSDEQAKIEEFMTMIPSVMETRETVLSNASPQLINTTISSPMSRVTSPLAFSYDSRSRDSEGSPQPNKVKSIREMFLAKSTSDNQFVTRQPPRPLRSDQSDSYPGTSDSGATGSQNSPDNSSAEEDTGRLAIAKGYVLKTIERLYGKGGTVKTHEASKPTSALKANSREAIMQNTVRGLAALHEARSRVTSDLSYFNATSSIDMINEPTQCVSMSAQVSSLNAVLIDEGRWLLRDNRPLETTPSELLGAQTRQKSPASDFEMRSDEGDRSEDTPYSHFSSVASVKVDIQEPVAPHCTYLTLPHLGDSEPDEDERREGPQSEADASKERAQVQKVGPITEAPKASLERNGALPGFMPELRRSDNKVHPLMSILPLAPPVVTQPSKRQAGQTPQAAVIRRPNTTAEPDFLETLYVMCGEHCPFL
ncbi:hypothetical protein ACEWY4_018625 [Coilia grayii]|uniref:Doublecortin domain-containing protein n=1 Tax=Coilia grayii TaxID=363190 RepID=A0ABD1JFZ6_9TELE